MANSRSELPPRTPSLQCEALASCGTVKGTTLKGCTTESTPLKIRGARGVMKPDGWIRRGKENNAWPGQRCKCLSSLRGVPMNRDDEAIPKTRLPRPDLSGLATTLERQKYSGGSCTFLKRAA